MPLHTLDELLALRAHWRQAGHTVVMTNGVFDLLHVGHVAYLSAARDLGDLLLVGLNSDTSTRTLKGPQRPLVPAADRAALLLALRCVEYVTIFEQPTAEALVAAVQPEIYVKGGDYQHHSPLTDPADNPASPAMHPPIDEARLPEARVVRSYGGQVRLLPYHAGHSTSALIERIVRMYHARPAQDTT